MVNKLVSVVIPTLNREEMLCATIDYFLSRETYVPFELIVVDQSETHEPATARYLESVAGRLRYERRPYKSLPRARNDALALARGEIIVFVDDDVEPRPGFLAGHVAPYADPKVWAVTGPSPPPGEALVRRDQISEAVHRRLVAGDNVFLHVDFDYAPASWGAGCNLSVRADVARRIGGFDETFVGNALGEDAEFCYRIKTGGGVIYYSARAALVHLQAKSGGCRSVVGTDYVKTYARNQNYFLRTVHVDARSWLASNWQTYRQFVFNRQSLVHTLGLHWAFAVGMMRGIRQKRLPQASPVSGHE